ncbi:hypothetical protein ACFXAZ_06985 [Streptomyces sp. NPDC059477]
MQLAVTATDTAVTSSAAVLVTRRVRALSAPATALPNVATHPLVRPMMR